MKTLQRSNIDEHERARNLAAGAIDMELEPAEATWLAAHLESCADCTAVADEYEALHLELANLEAPEPPRDLWARTAAALDAVDAERAGARRSFWQGRRSLVGTYGAVAAVVVLAVASLVAYTPLGIGGLGPNGSGKPSSGGATGGTIAAAPVPLAVVDGKPFYMASDGNRYSIVGGTSSCTVGSNNCTAGAPGGQALGSVVSDTPVSAALDADASSAVVWTSTKVAVLPLTPNAPDVQLDSLTPQPTIAAPTETPTAAASLDSFAPESPAATDTPAATATAASSSQPGSSDALVILSGYEITGPAPQFSADGSMLAFAARPIDHSTGADIFVWLKGDLQARAVTSRHSALFAGWFGARMLISEIALAAVPFASQTPGSSEDVATATPTAQAATGQRQSVSFIYDPATDIGQRIMQPMLMPQVDPTGTFVVYWNGVPAFDPATGLWQPGAGELYFDRLSNLTLVPTHMEDPDPLPAVPTAAPTVEDTSSPSESPGETPTAQDLPSTLPQLIPVTSSRGTVAHWLVRWDSTGKDVAVWVADANSTKIGVLNLYSIDVAAPMVQVSAPLLAADKVMSNVSFDNDSLVYTSAVDGKTYIQGLPTVPPSSVATSSPTTPGQLPEGSGDAPTLQPGS